MYLSNSSMLLGSRPATASLPTASAKLCPTCGCGLRFVLGVSWTRLTPLRASMSLFCFATLTADWVSCSSQDAASLVLRSSAPSSFLKILYDSLIRSTAAWVSLSSANAWLSWKHTVAVPTEFLPETSSLMARQASNQTRDSWYAFKAWNITAALLIVVMESGCLRP